MSVTNGKRSKIISYRLRSYSFLSLDDKFDLKRSSLEEKCHINLPEDYPKPFLVDTSNISLQFQLALDDNEFLQLDLTSWQSLVVDLFR